MRRSLPLLVAFAVLAAAPVAVAADPPLRPALRTAQAQIDWTNLTRAERRVVLRRWAATPALFDALLDRVAPQLSMQRSLGTEIAQGNFTDMVIGELLPAWQVNLSPAVLGQPGALNAHITLHELAHAVDGVLGTEEWRQRLFAVLARSARWQACWPLPLGSSSRCVRSDEILADQFAFWATGRRWVRSSYAVPPLLRRAEMGAQLARLLPSWASDRRDWTASR